MILETIAQAVGIQTRSSPESPHTPLTDPSLWDRWDMGSTTHAGVRVNEETAKGHSAVWAAVRLLAETIAFLPWVVYERMDGGGRSRARNHPVYKILHDEPNTELTPFQFVELLAHHVLTWGNAYAELQTNGAGRPVALWPIPPHRVCVVRREGRKFLAVTLPDGTQTTLTPGNYLHLYGMGYDGMIGYSPIRVHRQTIGKGLAAREYGARWFGGGGTPPAVLRHPAKLSPEAADRIRRQFQAVHGSLSQSHRLAVLEEGMEWQNIGVPAGDAQFLDSEKFSVTEAARIFRVPPHFLGDLERATFSNIEQQAIEFVTYSLAAAWLKRFEQAADKALLRPQERPRFYSEFLVDALLRGDSKTRAEALAIKRQWGIISADEWRELENMNPQGGEQGKAYLVPINYMPAEQLVEGFDPGAAGTAPAPAPPAEEDGAAGDRTTRTAEPQLEHRAIVAARERLHHAFEPLFERAIRRLANAQSRELLRALKEAIASDAPVQDLVERMQAFWDGLPERAKVILAPVLLELTRALKPEIEAETGSEGDITEAKLQNLVDEYSLVFGKRFVGQSRDELLAAMEGAEDDSALEENVAALADAWTSSTPADLAQEEVTRSGGALARAMYVLAGVTFLVWRATSGACPLCGTWNGRRVGTQTPFGESGDMIDPDGEDVAPLALTRTTFHPPMHRGCRCIITSGR